MLFLIGSNALGLPNRSFDFSLGSGNSYLSMTDGNFGSYSLSKLAFSFWLKTAGTGAGLFSQWQSWTLAVSGNNLVINTYDASANNNTFTGSTSLSSGTWYHVLVHLDPTNATSSDRIKVWINGSAETAGSSSFATSSALKDSTNSVYLGAVDSGAGPSTTMGGKMYQVGFFSGTLPPIAAVYQSGKKDISYETGLYSYVHTNTPNILDDSKITTDWTNNGSPSQVALSSDVP